MPDDIFGPLLSFHDIERALIEHIGLWLDTYLYARERKNHITPGAIARPRSYLARQDFSLLPGQDFLPAIIVISDGLDEEAHMHGDGHYDGIFRFGVAALVHSSEAEPARELAGHYQAALLTLLIQKKKFHGSARIEGWSDLAIDDVDVEQTRTYCAARLEFLVRVSDFAASAGGPAAPVPPPQPELPQRDNPLVLKIGINVDEPYIAPVSARAIFQVTGGKTS